MKNLQDMRGLWNFYNLFEFPSILWYRKIEPSRHVVELRYKEDLICMLLVLRRVKYNVISCKYGFRGLRSHFSLQFTPTITVCLSIFYDHMREPRGDFIDAPSKSCALCFHSNKKFYVQLSSCQFEMRSNLMRLALSRCVER